MLLPPVEPVRPAEHPSLLVHHQLLEEEGSRSEEEERAHHLRLELLLPLEGTCLVLGVEERIRVRVREGSHR